MLGNFEHKALAVVVGLKRVQDRRQLILKLHVDDGAGHLRDPAGDALGVGWVLVAMIVFPSVFAFLERLGARNDLDQFLGDLRLTAAVVEQRIAVDHVAGVPRGVVHGAHLGALLRSDVLEQRPENLDRQVARQEVGEDRFLVRLVFVAGAAADRRRCGPATSAGMSCRAVGTCEMTDLNSA